jgi:hypothetical protein
VNVGSSSQHGGGADASHEKGKRRGRRRGVGLVRSRARKTGEQSANPQNDRVLFLTGPSLPPPKIAPSGRAARPCAGREARDEPPPELGWTLGTARARRSAPRARVVRGGASASTCP